MTTKHDPRPQLAQLLEELRLDQRISKAQLARKSSLSLALVQKLEHGDCPSVRLRTAYLLANALEVPVLRLLEAFLQDRKTRAGSTGLAQPEGTQASSAPKSVAGSPDKAAVAGRQKPGPGTSNGGQ